MHQTWSAHSLNFVEAHNWKAESDDPNDAFAKWLCFTYQFAQHFPPNPGPAN